LQYKNKKNLYKILFIVILLGFIISLVGCNWFSLGLLNIFDPQAQIIVNYTEINIETGSVTLEVYSLNRVEFFGSGFSYDYYVGTTKIPELSKTVGATFYVAPSTTPGTHGPITTIDNLPLYFQKVLDYLNSNPYVTELICTINLIGTDGAGHDITKPVTFDLPALQPGIDVTPPNAVIATTPTDTAGTVPFTVIFDASASTDDRGIASYNWIFGDGSSGMGITANHTYDNPGIYIVTLTVTDFFGNEGFTNIIITANEPEAPTAIIVTVPAPPTGSSPLKVYFDAYSSTSEIGIVSYYWEFGDGDTGTGITVNHTYNTPGTYLVYLTVTDENGYEAYGYVTVTVNETTPSLSAEITITDWKQDYYEYLEQWSDLVKIWYKITNTGIVNIYYYQIWFTAYCKDGSSYQDWTNGLSVNVGHSIDDFTFISVPNKEVIAVEITDYELETY
jgi:PKD repeat protein